MIQRQSAVPESPCEPRRIRLTLVGYPTAHHVSPSIPTLSLLQINFINTVSRGLKAGTVWVNCYNVYESAVPFGETWEGRTIY